MTEKADAIIAWFEAHDWKYIGNTSGTEGSGIELFMRREPGEANVAQAGDGAE